MKKYLWIFIFFILIAGIIFFLIYNNNSKEESYIAQRTSTNENNNTENTININENKEEISQFYTKLSKFPKGRYSNINLACDTLNGTIVKSGDTFSFWKIVGNPTKDRGYKKAKSFGYKGKIERTYGGGLCQVSTTIYNAVLKAKGLKVVERYEHSRDVSYVKDGKDATVAYGQLDFKFKNTLDYDIQIEAYVKKNKLQIKLLRI